MGRRCWSRKRRLARPAAHHRPYFLASPGSQHALGGVGEIAAAVAPALREPAVGRVLGVRPPHHSCRYGPSFPLPPPLHRPGLGHPQILSPPWHRHRDRDRASRHHRCRSLAGEGARPPGPPAPLRCGRERGGRRAREGAGMGERWGWEGRLGAGWLGRGARAEEWERRGLGTSSVVEGLTSGLEPGEGRAGNNSKFGTGVWTRESRRGDSLQVPQPSAAPWPHLTFGWPGLLPRNAVRHPLLSGHRSAYFSAAFHVGIDPY